MELFDLNDKEQWTDKNSRSDKEFVFLRCQDYYRKVSFSEILFIEASESCCIFYLNSGNKWKVAFALAAICHYLPEEYFIRVHRSFIVNLYHVDRFIGNMFYVGDYKIPIGRMYRKEVFAKLNILGTS